jgi:hypothetical protein
MSVNYSTYIEFTMDDTRSIRYNHPWEIGTLRHPRGDGTWSVSSWADNYWGTAQCSWHGHGGEYFDGASWKKLDEYAGDLSLRRHLEILRNKK